ncbi:Hypothetical predicted protein [Marmota monax]|uniref:Cytosolic fatty-acid binding proteins domain-containing protein n=1 Tax=Marmota monax TaxID=9995 RepID=A0A5E4D7P4_MARMO|nr:hypothetical protein GHT09_006332 [Marmota monax]VTJ90058.1 Hypothetical predicted protein [Marmota monax]
MATIQHLEGRWHLVDYKGFDGYTNELREGLTMRKMGAMAKSECIITLENQKFI